MSEWWVEYVPVENPVDNKKGWHFPYSGDDWPEKDDWYWVYAGKDSSTQPYRSTPPKIAWWDGARGRFLALNGADVLAWRKAVVAKKRSAN